MRLFLISQKKSSEEKKTAPISQENPEVLSKLYEQNHELAIKNKTLSLLRQLYQISILALETNPLAFQIVKTVRETLEYEFVGIFSVDHNANTLTPLKFNLSDRLLEIEKNKKIQLEDFIIKDASNNPFFKKIFNKTENHTENLSDIWQAHIPEAALSIFSDSGHIKTISAYPLIIDEKLIGVLVIGLNRPHASLSQFEKDSIANLVDVTAIALDRARLYEEVKIANAKLTEANDQQVTLIHFITHQVKGFLAKSRNIFAGMLEGDYGDLSADTKVVAQEGLDSDTKGVSMVQDILNAANIRKGTVAYTFVPIDIAKILKETTDELLPIAQAKKLELTISLPSEPCMINGDQGQLQHALKNVIDNSIKYTPTGSVKVAIEKINNHVVISVKDTGVGITPEDAQRLFTEGGHGKNSQKVNVESTGYGLFIVKNIITAHKGTIRAESEGEGKGSQFYIDIPISAV